MITAALVIQMYTKFSRYTVKRLKDLTEVVTHP